MLVIEGVKRHVVCCMLPGVGLMGEGLSREVSCESVSYMGESIWESIGCGSIYVVARYTYSKGR